MTEDHPRSRGNHFRIVFSVSVNIGSPPLAREPLVDEAQGRYRVGITPARAGTTLLAFLALPPG